MSKLFWNTLKLGPTVLGVTLLMASSTLAAQTVSSQTTAAATDKSMGSPKAINQSTLPPGKSPAKAQTESSASSVLPVVAPNTVAHKTLVAQSGEDSAQTGNDDSSAMDEVTNVSQFQDVQPSDWAYEALSRIVQTYGCLQGYPDSTYRGNRALSRYEFAAGLNACLKQIEALIANQPNRVSRQDFEALQRLAENFRPELASLGTRVDKLESRTAFLDQHQFSSTTKLNGEVIIGVSEAFGKVAVPSPGKSVNNINESAIITDRVRLNFDTSFTGKDRLRTRLQARNFQPFGFSTDPTKNITGTNMTRLGFDGNDSSDTAFLSRLQYRFPLGKKGQVFLEAIGGEIDDDVYNFNTLFQPSGSGSISRFGRFNPIYRQGSEGTGAVLNYDISKHVGLSLGYLVPKASTPASGGGNYASDPRPGFGLFDGSYAGTAQLAFRSNSFNLGLVYAHTYNKSNNNNGIFLEGNTGSAFANAPFGPVDTSSNQYSVEASLLLSPKFVISGWGGYTRAIQEVGGSNKADIWNYAVTLGFPDFGKKGNLLGFVLGVPPKVTSNDVKTREDKNTSYHVEGFYRYRVGSNVYVTPGVLVIFNPEHNYNNDTQYVGTLRTTFNF